MEFKKVFKTALCIIPPEETWEPIQAIRKLHDKAYTRWMPHFNYLYPFVSFEEFPEAEKLLKEKLSKIEPFSVKIEKFGYFEQKDTCVLWVKPESEMLQKLHQRITEVYESNRKDFKPHITVGQFPKNQIVKVMQDFQKSWKPIEFEVNEICLIGRYGNDDPMKVRSIIPFGKENKSKIEIFPIEKQPEKHVLFIGNLSTNVVDADLKKSFEKYDIKKTNIVHDNTGVSKGYGFLEFEKKKEMESALKDMDGFNLKSRQIKLSKANK